MHGAFSHIYARKTEGIPKTYPAPGVESTLQEVQQFLPDLKAKMIEFLFFSVLRLCGSRQVVAHCRADERIEQMQLQCPALESQKSKMIEFLAEWVVTLLSPATQIVKARASHLTFMFVKEYWFREFYLGLKVTASLGREESYTRIIDGQDALRKSISRRGGN